MCWNLVFERVRAPALFLRELNLPLHKIMAWNEIGRVSLSSESMGKCVCNTSLWHKCDKTYSDECELAARAKDESESFFHQYRTKLYYTRCATMRFHAREVSIKCPFLHRVT